jgi:hypothetical protein
MPVFCERNTSEAEEEYKKNIFLEEETVKKGWQTKRDKERTVGSKRESE